MATAAEPAFHDVLEEVWGRRWGAHDETGVLRSVLVRPPSRGLARIRADAWDADAQALVDPDGRWYWTDRRPPDLDRLAEQHRGLVHALVDEGVDVVVAPPMDDAFTKAVYVRDPIVTVPGGAIVGRMAVLMRRGEEADLSRVVAGAGMPVLGDDDRHRDARGRVVREAARRRRGAGHVDPLQRRGRRRAARRARADRLGARRRPAAGLHDPPRHAPGDARRRSRARRRRRAAVHVPHAPAARWGSTSCTPGRASSGAEPARARAAPRAHGRGQPGHHRAPARRPASRCAPSPTTRSTATAAACTARRWSWSAIRLRRARRTRPRCPGRSACGRRGGSPSRCG